MGKPFKLDNQICYVGVEIGCEMPFK